MSDSTAWAELKEIWFAMEALPPDERAPWLSNAALSDATRSELERMLRSEMESRHRFELPAHVRLGFIEKVADDVPSLIGQRVGSFRVDRLVGRGGMGAVYEAHRDDADYAQRVAIKTLWRGADSDVLLQRFRAERKILASLQHPNIAQLIDGGATETGMPWLAMEFVDGQPIDKYCDAKQLDIPARLDLFREVCDAVFHAHQRLVVHRDLKPGNVLVHESGNVTLLDFGVAKLLEDGGGDAITGDGLSPFTAAYAAPEQVRGEPTTTSTDVYSLGALLCTLLAGAPPIEIAGFDAVSRLLAAREGITRKPSQIALSISQSAASARGFASPQQLSRALDGELDAIVASALRADPARRYDSARALSDDVRRYLRRERVLAKPDTVGYRARSFVRRYRAGVVGALATLIAIVAGLTITLRQASAVREEAARSERAAAFMSTLLGGTSGLSHHDGLELDANSTVEELLDSAIVRIPRQFANDDRLRARLYTAFGANYASRLRYASAHSTLDSAVTLAERAYGTKSDAYGEAIAASLALELDFKGPGAVANRLTTAERLAEGRWPRYQPSLMSTRAGVLYLTGSILAADSLARVAEKAAAHQPELVGLRLVALNVRRVTSSWIDRDPRIYIQRSRDLSALADSMSAHWSVMRVQADVAEFDGLVILGRVAAAESLAANVLARERLLVGKQPMLDAAALRLEASLAGLRGDTAAKFQALASARTILDRVPHVAVADQLLFSNQYVDAMLARGDTASARSMAEKTRDALAKAGSPLMDLFVQLYLGNTQLASRNAVRAEAELKRGLATLQRVPELRSMGPRLRRVLVAALEAQGRTHEADSVRQLDPLKTTIPACTPGGRWAGCPDLPASADRL